MERLLVLAVLLGSSKAIQSSGYEGPGVVSRRDGDSATGKIYDMVLQTLNKARQGISAKDLGDAAENVQTAADAYVDANGGEVPANEIEKVIADTAVKFDGIVAVSALFDDALTYTATVMDSALTLWNGLVTTAKELEQAGQSPTPAIAAISMTAEAIVRNVILTEGIVTYLDEQAKTDSGNPAKRWKVSGNVGYGPGGPGVSVGVSHSWRREALAKRGWGVHLGGSIGVGGWGIRGGISFSWRRR